MIFDPKKSGDNDRYLVESNIEKWAEIVKQHNVKLQDAWGDIAFAEAVGRRGSTVDEIQYQLECMAKFLVEDEEGKLEQKKETYRVHKIDYRKTFPNIFPECQPTKREIARAKTYREKSERDIEKRKN